MLWLPRPRNSASADVARTVAVLDANVLFPARLRDLFYASLSPAPTEHGGANSFARELALIGPLMAQYGILAKG